MSGLKIHVGRDGSPRAMGDRFVDAWKRAEAGGTVNERHLSFTSLQEAASVLTPRRVELLRSLHASPAATVRALADRLGRDYKNVHADVQALVEHGLIDRSDLTGLSVDYDGITAELAVAF
jgi:predicted transcriptional regulator